MMLGSSVARGRVPASLWLLPLLLLPLLSVGCAKKPRTMNSVFQIADQGDIDQAVQRGKSYRGNPYAVYSANHQQDPNFRVSPNVIVHHAILCMPSDEVAFAVASLPATTSDDAISQKVDAAIDDINRQVKFVVDLQLTQNADPNAISFEMLTNAVTHPYPPVLAVKPQLLNNLPGSPEGDVAAGSLYRYVIYFETIGSPGYPALDFSVSSLDLVVKDGNQQAPVHFQTAG